MDKKLVSALAEVFGLKESEIHLGLNKSDVGSWDSLKQMDLILTLEREFETTLEIQDIVRMTSVQSIMDVMNEKGICLGN